MLLFRTATRSRPVFRATVARLATKNVRGRTIVRDPRKAKVLLMSRFGFRSSFTLHSPSTFCHRTSHGCQLRADLRKLQADQCPFFPSVVIISCCNVWCLLEAVVVYRFNSSEGVACRRYSFRFKHHCSAVSRNKRLLLRRLAVSISDGHPQTKPCKRCLRNMKINRSSFNPSYAKMPHLRASGAVLRNP